MQSALKASVTRVVQFIAVLTVSCLVSLVMGGQSASASPSHPGQSKTSYRVDSQNPPSASTLAAEGIAPTFDNACYAFADRGTFRESDATVWVITNVRCTAPIGWQLLLMDRTTNFNGKVEGDRLPPINGKLFTGSAHAECSTFEIIKGTEKTGWVTVSAVFQELSTGACAWGGASARIEKAYC
jgi:hypothetical protein